MSEGVMLVEVIITDLQMKKHHTLLPLLSVHKEYVFVLAHPDAPALVYLDGSQGVEVGPGSLELIRQFPNYAGDFDAANDYLKGCFP